MTADFKNPKGFFPSKVFCDTNQVKTTGIPKYLRNAPSIMEKGGSFYEMVDLGFGKCRFALATKKGKDVYGGYKTPVIATKYPAVTKAFFNKKNMDVETIKIEGSVELAPLLELADGIVDIVETGTTLKENGLEVVENVAPISARVIVNLASAKMKKAAIQKVIAELESGLEK